MTVSTLTDKLAYVGDGLTTAFAIDFPFFSSNPTVSPEVYPSIKVYTRVIATGVETLRTYGASSDYDIAIDSGTEPQQGDLTWRNSTVIPATEEIHIRRDSQLTQPQAYPDGGSFPSVAHEQSLDWAALRAIDAQEVIGRALTLPVTDPNSGMLPNSVDRANKILAFGANGQLIIALDAVPAAVSAFMTPVLTATTEGAAKTLLEISDEPNMIYNPCGHIEQRFGDAGATPNDLAYVCDGWKTISDGNGRVTTGEFTNTVALAGATSSIVLSNLAANKHGQMQILDADATAIIVASGAAEIGFHTLRSAANVSTNDLYILKWTGAADAPTADPIDSWEADGTKPTFIVNWEEVLEVNLALQSSAEAWEKFSYTTSTSITDANNLAFFYGPLKDTPTAAGRSNISLIVMRPAGSSTFLTQPKREDDLLRCQKTYWKTFPYATVPADNVDQDGALRSMASGGNPNFSFHVRNPVPMLKAATYTVFNADDTGGTAAEVHNLTDNTSTAATIANATALGCAIRPTSNDATDADDEMVLHLTVAVEL